MFGSRQTQFSHPFGVILVTNPVSSFILRLQKGIGLLSCMLCNPISVSNRNTTHIILGRLVFLVVGAALERHYANPLREALDEQMHIRLL
jgi:hypothetical protein